VKRPGNCEYNALAAAVRKYHRTGVVKPATPRIPPVTEEDIKELIRKQAANAKEEATRKILAELINPQQEPAKEQSHDEQPAHAPAD
jgi:hypothetical protein